MVNPCQSDSCSHKCLLIPGGYQCSCPDGTTPVLSLNGKCNAAFEQEKNHPYRCLCRNGGSCVVSEQDSTKKICKCLDNYEGSHCEEFIPRSIISNASSTWISIMLPIFIILFTFVTAFFIYTFFKRRNL